VETILCDTNILIELLKGNEETIRLLQEWEGELCISAITAMELYYGALNKKELKMLERFVAQFEVIHLTERISRKATSLVLRYAKSHGLDIPDSIIAAMAMESGCRLMTYNRKDFQFIEGLELVP